jgi:hypothetical protein
MLSSEWESRPNCPPPSGAVPLLVLPLNMVDNSTSSCERVSGWISSVDRPDRPPLLEVRLHRSASLGTFTDSLATWHASPIRLV